MERLYIDAGRYTPEISCDPQVHILNFKGESYAQDAGDFYAPVISWVKEYLDHKPDESLTVNIDLNYFNSSSSKILLDFFYMLDKAAGTGKTIAINWYYDSENEDNLEYGQEFEEELDFLNFMYIVKDS